MLLIVWLKKDLSNMKSEKQRNDFALVLVAYIVAVIIICLIIPPGKIFAEVAVILFLMSCFLQSYWNEHLKK